MIPGLGGSPGEGNGKPLQYSCLGNPMDMESDGLQSIDLQRVGHTHTLVYIKGFPCGSAGKESACNEGDLSLIPGLGRSPGEGCTH